MLEDLIGQNNGFLLVLSYIGIRKKNSGKSCRYWSALCQCGKEIEISTGQFKKKQPKSCGCYQQIRRGNKNNHTYHTKHGFANRHPLYRAWKNMKQRCYNLNNSDYSCYGGKGIIVCDEWRSDSGAFILWGFENGWEKGLTIDRIDSSSNYSPSNCRFITASANSKRINPKKGSSHKDSILIESEVSEIKKLIENGMRSIDIAKKYDISPNIIYQIRSNKTWRHVK